VRTKGKTGRADIALNLINRLFGIERSLPVLAQKKNGWERRSRRSQLGTVLGKVVGYLASNWNKLEWYVEQGYLSIDNSAAEHASRSFVMCRRN
jgi:hypothetical protein